MMSKIESRNNDIKKSFKAICQILIMARGHNQYLGDSKADSASSAKLSNNSIDMNDETVVENNEKDESLIKSLRNNEKMNDDEIYKCVKNLANMTSEESLADDVVKIVRDYEQGLATRTKDI